MVKPDDIVYAQAVLSQIPNGVGAIMAIPQCGLPYRFLGDTAARIYHGEEISSFFEMEVLRRDAGKWTKILVSLSAQVFIEDFFAPARSRGLVFELKQRGAIGSFTEFKGIRLPPPEELFVEMLKRGGGIGHICAKRLAAALSLDKRKLLKLANETLRDRIRQILEGDGDEHGV